MADDNDTTLPTSTGSDLLDIVNRVVLSDGATMTDINRCQAADLDVLIACRNLYGWADPSDRIARGEMNAVQFVQALQLARAHRNR